MDIQFLSQKNKLNLIFGILRNFNERRFLFFKYRQLKRILKMIQVAQKLPCPLTHKTSTHLFVPRLTELMKKRLAQFSEVLLIIHISIYETSHYTLNSNNSDINTYPLVASLPLQLGLQQVYTHCRTRCRQPDASELSHRPPIDRTSQLVYPTASWNSQRDFHSNFHIINGTTRCLLSVILLCRKSLKSWKGN